MGAGQSTGESALVGAGRLTTSEALVKSSCVVLQLSAEDYRSIMQVLSFKDHPIDDRLNC
jgi:hypothetical protein